MSDPTPVDTPADAEPDFAAFEAAENRKVLGEAEPEPAPVAEPVAEPEAEDAEEPEPEPVVAAVPEKQVSKRQKHLNELVRARAESDARATKLEAEIAELKKPKQDAEPPVAAAPVTDPKDPEPQETDFDDYRSFVKALSRWEIRQDRREAEADAATKTAAEREATRVKAFETTVSGWIGRRDAFLAKHPERTDRLMAFLDPVRAGTPLGDALMESEVGGELADYLASNPTEAERIARLAPISALRALGQLETLFAPLTHASARAQPAAKTVTTAPAPPTTLSARSATVADLARAAVDRGDFSAFEAEENRKALAASR